MRRAPIDTARPYDAGGSTGASTGGSTATSSTGTTTGRTDGCADGMTRIEDFCIDTYEAHLVGHSPYEIPTGGEVAASASGMVPQAHISGDDAALACAAAGKRLCALDEWMRACQGPEGSTYPYGDTYDPEACNDTRDSHPVIDLFGGGATWGTTQMNDPQLNQLPDSLDPSGANPGCVSADGVYDLHGNLHEWIDDPDGTFKGGFYVDAVINGNGCHYTTTAHTTTYFDYSTGFRCCADPI